MLMMVEKVLGVLPLPTPPGFSLGSARYGAYYLYSWTHTHMFMLRHMCTLNFKLNCWHCFVNSIIVSILHKLGPNNLDFAFYHARRLVIHLEAKLNLSQSPHLKDECTVIAIALYNANDTLVN